MASLVQSNGPLFLLFLTCFRANQMGFGYVFDNLTFKRMTSSSKKIQSVANYF